MPDTTETREPEQAVATCTWAGCGRAGDVRVTFPSVVRGKSFVGPYCRTHADLALRQPGATIVEGPNAG